MMTCDKKTRDGNLANQLFRRSPDSASRSLSPRIEPAAACRRACLRLRPPHDTTYTLSPASVQPGTLVETKTSLSYRKHTVATNSNRYTRRPALCTYADCTDRVNLWLAGPHSAIAADLHPFRISVTTVSIAIPNVAVISRTSPEKSKISPLLNPAKEPS